jgi:hypothetical protein
MKSPKYLKKRPKIEEKAKKLKKRPKGQNKLF